ncbi:MAG: hypothetical protein ACREPE_01160, partial [Lysobacter sp.]
MNHGWIERSPGRAQRYGGFTATEPTFPGIAYRLDAGNGLRSGSVSLGADKPRTHYARKVLT